MHLERLVKTFVYNNILALCEPKYNKVRSFTEELK